MLLNSFSATVRPPRARALIITCDYSQIQIVGVTSRFLTILLLTACIFLRSCESLTVIEKAQKIQKVNL